MANPEREIKDMNEKISDLEYAISDLSGCVKPEIIEKLQSVVDEWNSYTRDCISELASAIDDAA